MVAWQLHRETILEVARAASMPPVDPGDRRPR
jgi:hypothetical protein